MNRVFLIAFVVCANSALALGAEQSAQELVSECQRRTEVRSFRCEGVMRVTTARGTTLEKRWTFRRKGRGGNSKTVIRFTEPTDVRGVSLLIVNYPRRQPEQWVWIPSNGKERRIISQEQTTRFLGIDFALTDFAEQDTQQYDYQLVGHSDVDGKTCWKIRAQPKVVNSADTSISYLNIRTDDLALAEIDKYTGRELVSKLAFKDIQIIGGILTPTTIEKLDVRNRSQVIVKLKNIIYNAAMGDEDFTIAALREGK